MANSRNGRRNLERYTIRRTNQVVKAGDCVLIWRSDTDTTPYVARVEQILANNQYHIKVRVRLYLRPEQSMGGRRSFHGAKELFLSDVYEVLCAHSIEGKCIVHSLQNYDNLVTVGADDYFYRFEYNYVTGVMTPVLVEVYCKCEMPYNPDVFMLQCEECEDWYHPTCVGMTVEQARQLRRYTCSDCSSDIFTGES